MIPWLPWPWSMAILLRGSWVTSHRPVLKPSGPLSLEMATGLVRCGLLSQGFVLPSWLFSDI